MENKKVTFENGIALYVNDKKVASIQQIYEPEIPECFGLYASETVECFGLYKSEIAVYIDKEKCKNNPELMMEIVIFLLEYRKNWINTRLFKLFKKQGLTDKDLFNCALSL